MFYYPEDLLRLKKTEVYVVCLYKDNDDHIIGVFKNKDRAEKQPAGVVKKNNITIYGEVITVNAIAKSGIVYVAYQYTPNSTETIIGVNNNKVEIYNILDMEMKKHTGTINEISVNYLEKLYTITTPSLTRYFCISKKIVDKGVF